MPAAAHAGLMCSANSQVNFHQSILSRDTAPAMAKGVLFKLLSKGQLSLLPWL